MTEFYWAHALSGSGFYDFSSPNSWLSYNSITGIIGVATTAPNAGDGVYISHYANIIGSGVCGELDFEGPGLCDIEGNITTTSYDNLYIGELVIGANANDLGSLTITSGGGSSAGPILIGEMGVTGN